ncbi:hypothetical protein [Candidatus Methanoperedens nitratireducens]|nr:hypothetical protein [Candidatus Methanoperedens nitroreducens]
MEIALSLIIFLAFINSASADVGISDFFSDFTSSDVTVNSSQDFQGKAVFELSYSGSVVESHEVPLNLKANEAATKVIIWGKQPQHDYYTARVSVYDNGKVIASASYQVSYGTVSLPSFHVVDFSPMNSGVKLLLRPFNPGVVDIKIQLLDNSDIIYEKTRDDVSLTANTEIMTPWPFLLTDNKKYTVRTKIFTHRLYAAPLINTYVANFTAAEDVEILPDDVEVDEYGASVTLRGNSQVPFDGSIVVKARNRTTNETQVYRQQVEEILTSGKEDTAGVVWRGLAPGTYDVEILAESRGNATLDRYETVLRIPEYPAVTATSPAQGTPGFSALLLIVVLLAAARRLKGE